MQVKARSNLLLNMSSASRISLGLALSPLQYAILAPNWEKARKTMPIRALFSKLEQTSSAEVGMVTKYQLNGWGTHRMEEI